MEVIGLIGGVSWNSTLEYYRLINGGFLTDSAVFIQLV